VHQARGKGITYSAVLHFMFLALVVFGLPEFLRARPIEEPQAITVEILPITGVTNVKPSETMPTEEKKPDEKSNPKPQPLVKTTEEAPPPPKPVEKPVEKKEEKKEEKKDEKKEKKKSKEEDLQAVLKAVKETAQKEDKNKKESKDDKSTSKSRSSQYDPTLPLSLSEKDAIRSQIAKCWSVPAGAKDAHELIVTLDIQLAEDGSVLKVELANSDKARYSRDTFFRAAADSAMRAVHLCSPLKDLPPDKFSTWRDMELTFDPKEMLF
jgi:outer membrane biosynthesis protein TonB